MDRGLETGDRSLRKKESNQGSYAWCPAWGARLVWTFSVIGIWCRKDSATAFPDCYAVLDSRA